METAKSTINFACNITFPECIKGGLHENEAVRFVCLEDSCQASEQGIICCSICVDELHKGHNIKSLKSVIQLMQNNSNEDQHNSIELEQLINYLDQQKQQLLIEIQSTLESWTSQIMQLQEKYESLYNKMSTQVLENVNSLEKYNNLINEIEQKSDDYKEFNNTMQIVVKQLLPVFREQLQKPKQQQNQLQQQESQQNDYQNSSQSQLIKSNTKKQLDQLQKMCEYLSNNFSEQSKHITIQLQALSNFVDEFKSNVNVKLEKSQFFLSSEFGKHPDIQILNSLTAINVCDRDGYKFALLNPSLQELNSQLKQSFAFKIHQYKAYNNWIGLGVCHQQFITQQQQLSFENYYQIGHGAYLIASNGSTWSDSDKDENGQVMSCFSFGDDDIINCYFDGEKKRITFIKEKTREQYQLRLQLKSNDPLCPCILFYYPQDKVEIINIVKEI